MAGCSGYVQYSMSGVILTIGFSNPSVGNNKVGVGFSGKVVSIDFVVKSLTLTSKTVPENKDVKIPNYPK